MSTKTAPSLVLPVTGPPAAKEYASRFSWLLLYDYSITNDFGGSYSPDLIHWKVAEDINFPPDARHGCVSLLTPEEAMTLLQTYPSKQWGKWHFDKDRN